MSNRTNSDYPNITIAGVWETQNGHFHTREIDDTSFNALTEAFEKGGKFLIRKRSEASLSKSSNRDKAPTYYLEFVPATEVERNKQEWKNKNSTRGL